MRHHSWPVLLFVFFFMDSGDGNQVLVVDTLQAETSPQHRIRLLFSVLSEMKCPQECCFFLEGCNSGGILISWHGMFSTFYFSLKSRNFYFQLLIQSLLFYGYESFACACVYVPRVFSVSPRSEGSTESLGTGVLDGCEPLRRCWELNPVLC